MKSKVSVVLENIHNRKSVRHFTGEPVTRADLITLLKAGMAAPSARNRQPWVFIAVTGRAKLDILGEGPAHTKMIFKAGAAIVVCGDTSSRLAEGANDLWWQDAAAATENILLAAEAISLGAVWCALYPYADREDFVRNILSIPPQIIPFSIIPIGHPTGEDLPKDKFREENIHWETW